MFGAIKLTKNVDPDKYKNSGYGIRFDYGPEFYRTDGSMGKMLLWVNCILRWFEWQQTGLINYDIIMSIQTQGLW